MSPTMSSGLPKPGTLIPPPKNSVTSAQPAPTQPSDKTAAEASTAAEAAIQAAAQASNMSLSAYASLSDSHQILVAVTVARPKLTSKSKIERPLLSKVFQYIL